MRGVNKVIIVGHCGRDPEARNMPDGRPVCNFSVATTEQWKNKAGGKEERTEWHNIVAFGPLADICAEYVRKGGQVYIEGKLSTRKWEKDGVTRYSTEIIASEMQLLGSRASGDKPQTYGKTGQQDHAKAASADGPQGDAFEDGIPF